MTPLIGITTYHRDERGYIQLPAQYADAVRRAGGIPLLIQPGEPRMDELMNLLDGLILSGGGDIDPAFYSDSEHAQVYWVNRERDQFEIDLVKCSLDSEKPTLCICRGMQVLNIALGGSLIQHIPDVIEDAVAHREATPDSAWHEITVNPKSRLASIMGTNNVTTASRHHQAIGVLAPGLEVVGRAPDGVIEAVEFPDKPNIIAVQWHPELTAAQDTSQQAIFDKLVKMSARLS